MDREAFLARQAVLRERLRHAVPRSARAKQLIVEIRELMTAQLRDELGGAAPASPPAPIAEPSADFRKRIGEITSTPASAAEPHFWWQDR